MNFQKKYENMKIQKKLMTKFFNSFKKLFLWSILWAKKLFKKKTDRWKDQQMVRPYFHGSYIPFFSEGWGGWVEPSPESIKMGELKNFTRQCNGGTEEWED